MSCVRLTGLFGFYPFNKTASFADLLPTYFVTITIDKVDEDFGYHTFAWEDDDIAIWAIDDFVSLIRITSPKYTILEATVGDTVADGVNKITNNLEKSGIDYSVINEEDI